MLCFFICARGTDGDDDRGRIDVLHAGCAAGCWYARGTHRRCARSCVSRGCPLRRPQPLQLLPPRRSPVAVGAPHSIEVVEAGAEEAATIRKAARSHTAVGVATGAASFSCSQQRKPLQLQLHPVPKLRIPC